MISRQLSDHYDSVIAFEPSGENRVCFSENLIDKNNVSLLPYAIGEKTMERVKLRIHPDNSGGNSLNEEYCGDCLREEEVISKSLDTLIGKTRRFGQIGLIKVDVQGHESEVLRGARVTIESHRPVIWCEEESSVRKNESIELILKELDYKKAVTVNKESIYIHKSKITTALLNKCHECGAMIDKLNKEAKAQL